MHAWTRFRQLDGAERRIVLSAAAALTVSWLALRVLGFRRSSVLLARPAPAAPRAVDARPSSGSAVPPQGIARLMHATARSLPFACNCLDRSLALCWLLRRRGVAASLRIGARKDGAQLKAHAWVESGGLPLDDAGAEHQHFVPFDGAVTSLETPTP